MEFVIIAEDYLDKDAIDRRLKARKEHLELGDKLVAEGKLLFAAATLDDSDKMVGSTLICNFSSRRELDQWLEVEPYVTGRVWEKIRIEKCKVAPSFSKPR